MKRKVIFGIIISVIFIYLVFREVDFQKMLHSLINANYLWLIPAFCFMILSHWVRAFRWRYFLEPIKHVKIHPLFSAVMIGYAANNVFPLRLGEFLRAFALGKSQQISKSSAFATVIVERLIDILTLLVLLSCTFLFFPLPEMIKNSGYFIFFISISAIIFIVLLMQKTESTIGVLKKIVPSRIFDIVQKILRSFLQGFIVFKKTDHYFTIIALSIIVWALYMGTVYTSFFAFDFPKKYGLNLFSSLIVLVVVSIGITIPSSPGFVGTYHWFCMKGLSLFGVPESEALSFAVISHAMNTIPFTVIGLFYFWRENLHFSDAVVEQEIVEHEIEEEKLVKETE